MILWYLYKYINDIINIAAAIHGESWTGHLEVPNASTPGRFLLSSMEPYVCSFLCIVNATLLCCIQLFQFPKASGFMAPLYGIFCKVEESGIEMRWLRGWRESTYLAIQIRSPHTHNLSPEWFWEYQLFFLVSLAVSNKTEFGKM